MGQSTSLLLEPCASLLHCDFQCAVLFLILYAIFLPGEENWEHIFSAVSFCQTPSPSEMLWAGDERPALISTLLVGTKPNACQVAAHSTHATRKLVIK